MENEIKRLERQVEIKQNSLKRKEAVLLSSVQGCATLKADVKAYLDELKDAEFIDKDEELGLDDFEDATQKELNLLKAIIKGHRGVKITKGQIEELELRIARGE